MLKQQSQTTPADLSNQPANEASAELPLPVVYQDEYLVVVEKPAGLLVHRSLIDKYETRFAMQMVRDQIGQHVYTVHRLDRPTSGILIFALSSDVARQMTEAFTQRSVDKRYLALVRGFAPESGCIEHALKEKLDAIADKKADRNKPPQEAVSRFRRLHTFELPHGVGRYPTARYSLVLLKPETGRKHQLRRHMSHINHPIVGDTNHGDNKHNHFVRQTFGFQGLALQSIATRFAHPITGEPLVLEANLDIRFFKLLTVWGWQRSDFRKIRSELDLWQI